MAVGAVLGFGLWLRQLRESRDLTRKELAAAVGVSVKTIEKIETGTRRPSRQVATLLAQYLGLQQDETAAFVRRARAELVDGAATLDSSPESGVQDGVRSAPNTLPFAANSFVGRRQELAAITTLMRRPAVRLLTLTGPPGIGKTRLALRVAETLLREFADGVYFVSLAALNDPAHLPGSIAAALGVAVRGGQPPLETVKAYLQRKRMLLLLDNFEHLISSAPLVSELLTATAHLKLLLTSRQGLELYGEHEFTVPPLLLPARGITVGQAQQYDAVSLFVDRVQAVRPDFALQAENVAQVVAITRRLEGLPLALELAAARSRILMPAELLRHLEQRLQLLSGGARDLPSRQRTLRAAIDWSYSLLSAPEQRILCRLAVFSGGWTLAAACSICGDQVEDAGNTSALIESLLRKSLLALSDPGRSPALQQLKQQDAAMNHVATETRFTMLEMIREYAHERLQESGEAEAISRRHLLYYLAVAEAVAVRLLSHDQAELVAYLRPEQDNFRAALTWALDVAGELDLAARLSRALAQFWELLGQLHEARHWHNAVADRYRQQWLHDSAHNQFSTRTLARVLTDAAWSAFQQYDLAAAQQLYDEALLLWREVDDAIGIGRVLNELGNIATVQCYYEQAHTLFAESFELAVAPGGARLLAMATTNLAVIDYYSGRFAAAELGYKEALRLFRELGDQLQVGLLLANIGWVYLLQGEYARARALVEESVALYSALGSPGSTCVVLWALGLVELKEGNNVAARQKLLQALDLALATGGRLWLASILESLACVIVEEGQPLVAAQLMGAAEAERRAIHTPLPEVERKLYEPYLSLAQQQLGEAAWQVERATGGRLSNTTVIELARRNA